jgi:membrane protease YdiL (CAAX protease family)
VTPAAPAPVARVGAAAIAFAAAFSLSVAASQALVSAAASIGWAGPGPPAADGARAFAVSSTGLMACGCLEGLVLLAVAVVAARLEGAGVAVRLRLVPSRGARWAPLAAICGLVGLTFAYSAATELAWSQGWGVMDLIASALRRPSPTRFALAVVAIGVVPAVGEETLFRGYIQPALTPSLGRWPAIVLTAAAFGVLHRDALQGAGAFAAGVFLGWTVERTGGLGPAIAAHAANNATFVVLASFGAAGALPGRVELAALAFGAAACATGALALRASTRAS